MSPDTSTSPRKLTAEDLLAGSQAVHEVCVPEAVLRPSAAHGLDRSAGEHVEAGRVRLCPLNVAKLILISRAARDDASLVPLLTIKEALIEPKLSLEQIRNLHMGLVHFLVSQINLISGLTADGETLNGAADSAYGQTHLILARHFGWTPEQVGQLTPGQVAVYLAGVEKLLRLEDHDR
jgi:hypothetical protein